MVLASGLRCQSCSLEPSCRLGGRAATHLLLSCSASVTRLAPWGWPGMYSITLTPGPKSKHHQRGSHQEMGVQVALSKVSVQLTHKGTCVQVQPDASPRAKSLEGSWTSHLPVGHTCASVCFGVGLAEHQWGSVVMSRHWERGHDSTQTKLSERPLEARRSLGLGNDGWGQALLTCHVFSVYKGNKRSVQSQRTDSSCPAWLFSQKAQEDLLILKAK